METIQQQFDEVKALVAKTDSGPHSEYTQEDADQLRELCAMDQIGITLLMRVAHLSQNIDTVFQQSGYTWNSYRSDKMEWYTHEFQDIYKECVAQRQPSRVYKDTLFYATTITSLVMDLLKNPLGSSYIHHVLPILIDQSKESICNGLHTIRLYHKGVVRSNQERKWTCPICHENDPAQEKIWLVSTVRDETGREACGHKIHKQCFVEASRYDSKCALCRREITHYATYRVNMEHEG